MADAAVAEIRNVAPKPTNPALKPSKAVSITFDGAGDTSVAIEKQNFGLVDFIFASATGVYTLLVSHTAGGTFVLLPNVSFDSAALLADGTSKLAGYGFFKLKQSSATAAVCSAGFI